jgi:signal peptidase I
MRHWIVQRGEYSITESLHKSVKTIFYTGASMHPTFRNLDRLFYIPYGDSSVKKGDVIVINSPSGRKIIHRVQSIKGLGIITMGDNNPTVDPWLLRPDQIMGRVVYALRGERMICIHGGFRGRIYALCFKSFRCLPIMLFKALNVPYKYLERSRLCGLFSIKTRIVAFKRADGFELQLQMAGHVIGKRRPGEKWQIRPPFRLLLKEKILLNELVVEESFD